MNRHLHFAQKRKATDEEEWLLNIDFAKRETFADACEFYSRILEQSRGPAEHRALLAQRSRRPRLHDDRADQDELLDILKEAVAARNGWKRILARCSKPKPGANVMVTQCRLEEARNDNKTSRRQLGRGVLPDHSADHDDNVPPDLIPPL